jgi:toxin CcdB
MARLDVYRFDHPSVPLVLDVQAGLLCDLATRVVIPLIPASQAGKAALPRLQPIVKIRGAEYVLMTPELAAARVSELGEVVANLEELRNEIIAALDFLFQGF